MLDVGKKRRLRRIMPEEKTLIVPMDHGVSCPVEGINKIDSILKKIDRLADAVVLHKGAVKNSKYIESMDTALIVHLSGSTHYHANDKVLVCSVEKAVSLGADGVSIHVNIGSNNECEQLRDAGIVSEICDSYGMPLLAMMYPRGKNVEVNTESVKHAVRVGYELGADIVKTCYTGTAESFAEVVEYCDVPVVVAGGSKKSLEELLEEVRCAVLAGASGVAVGRNVFQAEKPEEIVKNLRRVIHNSTTKMEVLYEGNLAVDKGR
jgi:predicted phospho-2-dehydro-3-deoxyheptonate aldolase